VNSGSIIDHETTVDDGVHVSAGVNIGAVCGIGTCSFVGIGATIMSHVTMGKNVFVGAGAVVLGDVPDNARGVYETLVKNKPDLSGVRFGIVSLGDSSHAQTFCFAGKRFENILAKLGAERVGEVLNHDASSGTMPEEATAEWMATWLAQAFEVLTPAP
jgi:sulfite reductase alpha subunit-like flavoprotein